MDTYIPKDYNEVIDILIKRKKLFFIPFFLIILLFVSIYPLLPKRYESTASILIEEDTIINPLVKGLAVEQTVDKRIKTLSAQILNWDNIVKLINAIHLSDKIKDKTQLEKKVRKMQEDIKIKLTGENIVQISYENQDPLISMNVTKIISENLVSKNREIRVGQTEDAINFIHNQLNVYKDKLQNSEKAFFLSKVNSELNEATKKKNMIEDQLMQVEKTIITTVVREQSPYVAQMRKELIQLESQINLMMPGAKKDNPMVMEYQKRAEWIRQRIKLEERNQSGSETTSMNPVFQELSRQLKELELKISSLEKKRADLQLGRFEMRNVSDQELLDMERDKKVNEDIYQLLLIRLENAQISQKLGDQNKSGSFIIIDPARLPLKPIRPNPTKTLAMGFLAAIFAGLGAVFVREYFDSSFRSIEDAKSYMDIPLMAYIPRIVSSKNKNVINNENSNGETKILETRSWLLRLMNRLPKTPRYDITYQVKKMKNDNISPYIVSYHDPESMPSEQYRLFQTHYLFSGKKKPTKVLLVTSALKSEGKTMTSINVAVTMATELNRKILLIDCDLRKGSIAQNLNVESQNGLMDYLAGSCGPKSLLKPTLVDRLTVITAGKLCNNPTRHLVAEEMKMLMEQLRSIFDIIIMDAPPIMNLSDVPVLAPYADSIVLAVQAGKTQRETVKNVQTILEKSHQCNVIGFVLTQVNSSVPSYIYQYMIGDN